MSLRGLLLWLFFSSASALAENPFDKAASQRDVARQRAFDRGQKTALPASQKREAIGRLPAPSVNGERSSDGKVVNQGAPLAFVYNRVMETRRHFKYDLNPYLKNANDTFTDDSELAEKVWKEAFTIYPDLNNPTSAFAMRYAVVNRWVDSRQPPLARDSRRSLLISHMVSLELNGRMAGDSFGLAQASMAESSGTNMPTVLKASSFEIEVRAETAVFPEGVTGKVQRGISGNPDVIVWQDANGMHQISLPQEKLGRVVFLEGKICSYQRIEMLGGDFRVRFTVDKVQATSANR